MADEPLFTEAPAEVTRYFEGKGQTPTFDWRDIAPEEHAITFTVAKTKGFEVLADLRSAVDRAIRDQQSFEEFRANIQPVLEAKGWWGQQLGSPRRLRTIHWANVATARAAGEWERTRRTRRYLPFLRYTLSASENRRPEHLDWVGTILPIDDPWWRTHYPPNGWGCKCGVRQITRRQAERGGYDEDTEAPPVEMRNWLDKRNGKRVRVPRGIDPGWAQNPGLERGRNAARFLTEQLETLPDNVRRTAVADLVASPKFKAIVDNSFGLPRSNWTDPRRSIAAPLASLPDHHRKALGADTSIVTLTLADAVKIADKHPEVTEAVYRQVQTMAETGEARMLNGKLALFTRVDRSWWVAVFKKAGPGEVFLNSLYRTNSDYVERRLGRK